MLSRVADSLFWMSRYLERGEHTARVLNVQLYLMLERGAGSDEGHWERVRKSLGIEAREETAEGFAAQMIHGAIHGEESPSSIVSCIVAARENARQVREQISSEMWEQLNRLFHAVKRADPAGDARDFLRAIQDGVHMFQGDYGFDHDARGRVAVHPGGAVSGAGDCGVDAGERAFPGVLILRPRRKWNRWSDRAVAIVHGVRGVLQSLYGGSAAGADCGVSGVEQLVSAFDPILGGRAGYSADADRSGGCG